VEGTKCLRDKDGLPVDIADNKFAQAALREQPIRLFEVIVDRRTDGSEKRSNRMLSLELALTRNKRQSKATQGGSKILTQLQDMKKSCHH
jgi:hypothetical protein